MKSNRKIACIAWRPGFAAEAGEWNLINGRNKSLSNEFNFEVTMLVLARRGWWSSKPQHLEGKDYKLEIIYYRSRLIGPFIAALKAMTFAKRRDIKVAILSGGFTSILAPIGKLLGMKTIWDIHGDALAELSANSQPSNMRLGRAKIVVNEWLGRQASGFMVVTEALRPKDVATKKLRTQCFVIPCASTVRLNRDQYRLARQQSRRMFCIPDDAVVLVHSGGVTATWQCFSEYLRDFELLGRENKNLILLCLTAELDAAHRLARDRVNQKTLEKIRIAKVPASELTHAICGADVGLLLREKNRTNECAFPNKIDDYLSAGVAIVTTHGLPAAAAIVESYPATGFVCREVSLIEAKTFIYNQVVNPIAAGLRWERASLIRDQHAFKTTLAPFASWAADSDVTRKPALS
jgi:hypothetical protein